jgi:hypothetical protein
MPHFFNSSRYVMASARTFCRIMKHHDGFEKKCSTKTKRCCIEGLKDNSTSTENSNGIVTYVNCM